MAKRSAVKPTVPPTAVKRGIEYVPPNSQEMDQYARAVCRELSEKVDPSFATPEFQRELSNFLKVVAAIYAKHLNRSGGKPLDTPFSKG